MGNGAVYRVVTSKKNTNSDRGRLGEGNREERNIFYQTRLCKSARRPMKGFCGENPRKRKKMTPNRWEPKRSLVSLKKFPPSLKGFSQENSDGGGGHHQKSKGEGGAKQSD